MIEMYQMNTNSTASQAQDFRASSLSLFKQRLDFNDTFENFDFVLKSLRD